MQGVPKKDFNSLRHSKNLSIFVCRRISAAPNAVLKSRSLAPAESKTVLNGPQLASSHVTQILSAMVRKGAAIMDAGRLAVNPSIFLLYLVRQTKTIRQHTKPSLRRFISIQLLE